MKVARLHQADWEQRKVAQHKNNKHHDQTIVCDSKMKIKTENKIQEFHFNNLVTAPEASESGVRWVGIQFSAVQRHELQVDVR